MQTFLPFPNARASAASLDRLRLGKQRVECYQLMRALLTPGAGYSNHPAARMWAGCEVALLSYARAVSREWTSRGYVDETYAKTLLTFMGERRIEPVKLPWWYGHEGFHEAHRSRLMAKAPELYAFDDTREGLPYLWPLESRAQGFVTIVDGVRTGVAA